MHPANDLDESGPLALGRFTLLRRERRLLFDGAHVDLGSRSLDVLIALASRPGQLLSKDELLDRVWPSQYVEEGNIAVQVHALRKLLGSESISTVPGRGYRLSLPIGLQSRGTSAAEPGHAAQTRPKAAMSTKLPSVMPPIFGRESDLSRLKALVQEHRLVTVIGAGGIGKTLLVQHLLDELRDDYQHGVCWVELAALTDGEAISEAIIAALGARPTGTDFSQRLVSVVGSLQILLALDNAEHLCQPLAQLVGLVLRNAPGVRLIVTSQIPLRAAHEHCYRLGALDVPSEPVVAQEAIRFGSVALFVERARSADSRFALTDTNVAAVTDICIQLDGLPLAIELAAARAPMLGVGRLAISMSDRLTLLSVGRGSATPTRQRTLRAALDWSHSLLNKVEQIVFRRLAVIAGSASLEAIQDICADAPIGMIDRLMVLDALCELVDRSLVSIVDSAGQEVPRYSLLESPKAYALEQLQSNAELDATCRRHLYATARLLESAMQALHDGRVGKQKWCEMLVPDLPNARDAMAFSRSIGDSELGAIVGLALLRALPDTMFAEQMAIGESIASFVEDGLSQRWETTSFIELAKLLSNTSRQDEARSYWKRALDAARKLDPDSDGRRLLHAALAGSVFAQASIGNIDLASTLMEELRDIEDPAWPPLRRGVGMQAAKILASAKGDFGERLQLSRKLYTLCLEAGMDGSMALSNLIFAEIDAGHMLPALELASKLVADLEHGRDEYTLCHARRALLNTSLATGDLIRAHDVAPLGWAAAVRFDLSMRWIDGLCLLCALESRPRSAALLLGVSQTLWESEPRDPSETSEFEHVFRLVKGALGQGDFEELLREGTQLSLNDIPLLAFGAVDAPAHLKVITRPTRPGSECHDPS